MTAVTNDGATKNKKEGTLVPSVFSQAGRQALGRCRGPRGARALKYVNFLHPAKCPPRNVALCLQPPFSFVHKVTPQLTFHTSGGG